VSHNQFAPASIEKKDEKSWSSSTVASSNVVADGVVGLKVGKRDGNSISIESMLKTGVVTDAVGKSGRERRNASISVVHRPLNVFASNGAGRRKWGRGQVLSDTAVPGTSVVQTDVSIHLFVFPLAPPLPPPPRSP
jgi:hypothetical protein